MMADYSHFVAKVAVDKGPDPSAEFRYLLAQSEQHSESIAWFATWHTAEEFHRAGNSICVLFYHPDDTQRIEAIIARVLSQHGHGVPPDDVRSFYHPWKERLKKWWPLGGQRVGLIADIVLTQFDSLDYLPGRSWQTGLSASETFVGQASFAGWKFDDDFNPLRWLQSLPGQRTRRSEVMT